MLHAKILNLYENFYFLDFNPWKIVRQTFVFAVITWTILTSLPVKMMFLRITMLAYLAVRQGISTVFQIAIEFTKKIWPTVPVKKIVPVVVPVRTSTVQWPPRQLPLQQPQRRGLLSSEFQIEF